MLDPELDKFLAEWAKKPGPDMNEIKELSTTLRMWRWDVSRMRDQLCRMVDANFAPQWLHCVLTEKHSWWGLVTDLTIVVRGERRFTVEFDQRLKRTLCPDCKTDYWDERDY